MSVRLGQEARIVGADTDGVVVQVGAMRVRARHVINCTYAEIGSAGVAVRAKVRRELTEMLLIEAPPSLAGVGITVMDGPFFSVMPYPAAPGLHTLSHVRHTPHVVPGSDSETGCDDPVAPTRSNRDAILRDSVRSLPCLSQARVVGSVFEVKATLARHEGDDGRPVLIERSEAMPRVLSVLGAKIDNIYEVRTFLRAQDWQMAA